MPAARSDHGGPSRHQATTRHVRLASQPYAVILLPCDRLAPPPHATIPPAPVSAGPARRHDARRSVPVVTAYILIQTEVSKAALVAKDIIDITGVQQAQAVTALTT
jgi:hypothetical protein